MILRRKYPNKSCYQYCFSCICHIHCIQDSKALHIKPCHYISTGFPLYQIIYRLCSTLKCHSSFWVTINIFSAEILNMLPRMGDVKIAYFYTSVLYSMNAQLGFSIIFQLFLIAFLTHTMTVISKLLNRFLQVRRDMNNFLTLISTTMMYS